MSLSSERTPELGCGEGGLGQGSQEGPICGPLAYCQLVLPASLTLFPGLNFQYRESDICPGSDSSGSGRCRFIGKNLGPAVGPTDPQISSQSLCSLTHLTTMEYPLAKLTRL